MLEDDHLTKSCGLSTWISLFEYKNHANHIFLHSSEVVLLRSLIEMIIFAIVSYNFLFICSNAKHKPFTISFRDYLKFKKMEKYQIHWKVFILSFLNAISDPWNCFYILPLLSVPKQKLAYLSKLSFLSSTYSNTD